ncbi:MAG: tRNA (N6-isopentenyl adenosine(37)-C2)-methylthiotransferase MiaB, partial [Planctomycetes bacterium]|nr:tRNA (N6-isopentenyl adenosine(37)-C2)-methylthiotransferase MiaB [Planctomycetota bacterium]
MILPDQKSFHLVTYGCQMNKLDSELVASRLVGAGYVPAESEDRAQIVLFNTCSVREHAEDRVWSRLGALKLRKRTEPGLIIGVLGCMAQEHQVFLRTRMPHVDLVCGTREFGAIDEMIGRITATRESVVATGDGATGDEILRNVGLRPNRAQAYINIIRGCNMPCTFCIVPRTRGAEVSRPVAEIVEEAARLAADGVTEVTLLGQTVNAYGHDLERGTDLALLLQELHEIPALRRIAFITSHPNWLKPRLMETMAALPRVSRYFHLPVQSGSDTMLERMKRRYTSAKYMARIRDLQGLVPEMEFASDFIVGFPGESEADHALSKELMEEVGFAQSFVFKYSPRPLTVAADYMQDDVPQQVKQRRNQELLKIQTRISLAKNEALVGSVVEVLVEGPSKKRVDRYTGRTDRHRLVHFPIPAQGESLVGRYVPVRLEEASAHSLLGRLVSAEALS